MELGTFSISLAVKDLEASKSFYEKFGFKAFTGDASQNWLILKNGGHTIGLFEGMLEHDGTGELHRRGSGWQPDPRRSARVSSGPRLAFGLFKNV